MGNTTSHPSMDPDPGRIHYKDHNIYLNFIDTYSRLPPAKPITIHQKALFTYWMSVFLFLLTLQLYKMYRYANPVEEKEPKKNPVKEVETVAQMCSPSKKAAGSANNSPSKRKDYLDTDAFNIPEKTADFLQVTIEETATNVVAEELKSVKESLQMKELEDDSSKKLLSKLKLTLYELCTATDADQPTFQMFLIKMAIFGFFMLYIFLTDYLHMWPKVDKQYSRDIFVFLFFVLVFVAVVFTITKTKDKLLNRDQTEEWKGWMQVQFVWYHYFDAQETFNSIRCYVGAYVWMTGFGNYIYFSTRKDYSIFRLLKMLFRLNFLVFCVMAMSNHEFVRYYICAMHTYWFLSVWAVMVAFNKYNDNPKFILLKFAVYFAINACIFNIPGAADVVFSPFLWALHDKDGTLRYWKYRAWLDHWSTLVGMFLAFNFERLEKFLRYLDTDDPKTKSQREALRGCVTAALLAVFAVWFYYVLLKPKDPYLAAHPFTSPIPIMIYVVLRNIHPILRTHYLNLFTWLGKITLETYLSQIHIYMIGDAKNILVYLPRYPMLNFTIATLIYVTFSYVLFRLTVFFSSYIFPRNLKVVIKNIVAGTLWLGACYIMAYALTKGRVWTSERSGLEFLRWNISKY